MTIKKARKHLIHLLLLLFFLLIGLYLILQAQIYITNVSIKNNAERIFKSCQSLGYKETCYADQFKELTKVTDSKISRKVLASLQQIDPINARGCHLMAHYISSSETRKDPAKWLDLLGEQDANSCSGGYIHGILEAHIGDDPSFELNAQAFPVICDHIKDPQRARLSCFHNLGHILLAEQHNNIDSSVNVCNQLANYWESYECLSGVFMENLTRLNLEAHGLGYIKIWNKAFVEETEKLCSQYEYYIAKACWKETSYLYFTVNNEDPEELYQACKKAPNKIFQDECYIYGVGNMIASSRFKEANIKKLCNVYKPDNELYPVCYYQVIGGMLTSSITFSDWAIEFCNFADDSFKSKCFNRIGLVLKKVTNSQPAISKVCSKVNKDYQQECLKPDNSEWSNYIPTSMTP